MIPAELQQPILDRAGGNPLYAEEFVRLLKDKDLLDQEGLELGAARRCRGPVPRLGPGADRRTPGHARRRHEVDARRRRRHRQGLLGRGDRADGRARPRPPVTDTLRELSRKELVRPARRSSIEGEAEYAFWHVLARDVAYGQLPRASRASRHVAAARWIESKAPERVEDLADVLAYHYATALELARAAGQTEQAAELEAPALRFLTLAGERALGLDTAAALSNLERALALAPADIPNAPRRSPASVRPPSRPDASPRRRRPWRRRSRRSGTRGDLPAAARAMATLGIVLSAARGPAAAGRSPRRRWRCWSRSGPPPSSSARSPRWPSQRPSREGPRRRSASPSGRSRSPRSSAFARPARALGYRGMARADLGDPGGLQDFREAIELATEAGQGREVALLHNNLGVRPLGLRRPRGVPGGPARGDRLREGPGAHRDARRPHGEHARRARRYGRARRGARDRRRAGPAPGGERGRVRPRRGPRGQARILALRGRAAQVSRHRSSGSSPPPAGPRTRSSSSSAWGRSPSRAPRSGRTRPRRRCSRRSRRTPGARDTRTTRPPPRDGAHRLEDRRARARRASRRAVSSPATPTPSTPSSRRTPPSPRPAGTCGPPPRPTPMPPIAGSGSGSSPSRRSRSSARAGVSRTRPTDRGRTRPAARPRDLRAAPGGPRARRDRRAPAAGHRAQLVSSRAGVTLTALRW